MFNRLFKVVLFIGLILVPRNTSILITKTMTMSNADVILAVVTIGIKNFVFDSNSKHKKDSVFTQQNGEYSQIQVDLESQFSHIIQ